MRLGVPAVRARRNARMSKGVGSGCVYVHIGSENVRNYALYLRLPQPCVLSFVACGGSLCMLKWQWVTQAGSHPNTVCIGVCLETPVLKDTNHSQN